MASGFAVDVGDWVWITWQNRPWNIARVLEFERGTALVEVPVSFCGPWRTCVPYYFLKAASLLEIVAAEANYGP